MNLIIFHEDEDVCRIDYHLTVNKIYRVCRQMSRKIVSAPSIDQVLEDKAEKEQYVTNLTAMCEMQGAGFHVADLLIQTYKVENETLKKQKQELKEILQEKEQEIQKMKDEGLMIKTLEKNILKYSQRVSQLLEQNLVYQQKIRGLQKQLEKERQQHQKERQFVREKLSRYKHQQNQRRQIENQFHNFLRMGQPEDSLEHSPKQYQRSVGKQSFITSATKEPKERSESNMKVLEWKLKQKDEQIIILLKRLNEMEEKMSMRDQSRHERIMTSDSMQNFYSNKNKKISEFTQ